MSYIVDSCVWIDFFSKKLHFNAISELLLKDEIYTNSIILAELRPSAMVSKQKKFIDCISALEEMPLNIDWNEVEEIQYRCIKSGMNKVGLLDIAIAQNAKQNGIAVFSTDKHIVFLSNLMGFDLRVE
ncbi:MAG: PIN domain-containing protein [Fibromonadaceae bacterium]|jgi:predicted nucleic acid-binding protein|nr:PIN domain-containing protein [Fibromonadaceae bacterium]